MVKAEQIKDNISHKTKAIKFQIQISFLGCCKQGKMEVEIKTSFTFERKLLPFSIEGPKWK